MLHEKLMNRKRHQLVAMGCARHTDGNVPMVTDVANVARRGRKVRFPRICILYAIRAADYVKFACLHSFGAIAGCDEVTDDVHKS